MSAKKPVLYKERPIVRAMLDLLHRLEQSLMGEVLSPIRVILTGGTAMALYSPQRSSMEVAAIFSHRILLPEALVVYEDEFGNKKTLAWDRNYSPSIGLLHPDAEQDAIFFSPSKNGIFSILVLTPIDLVVSKLSRLASNDELDILELYEQGSIDPKDLEPRAMEAIRYYVVDIGQVYNDLTRICERMGHKVTMRLEGPQGVNGR